MSWTIDHQATRDATDLFEDGAPIVKRNGRQFLVERSPYGQIEFIPLRRGLYLAAATSPPQGSSPVDIASVSAGLASHLRRNNLKPWQIVHGQEISEVLRNLILGQPAEDDSMKVAPWSPYVLIPKARGKLIGEARLQVAQQLAGLVRAGSMDTNPLAALSGPPGVGKHTVTEDAAKRLGLSLVELPLGRLLIDRVFQTPREVFLETIMAAQESLNEEELLVVSDAEFISLLPSPHRHQALLELSRLDHVVLLTNDQTLLQTADVVVLTCPGLAGTDEMLELLEASEAKLEIVGSALETTCRAAFVPGVGVIPARLLYLLRLGQALLGSTGTLASGTFSPDDATPAALLAQQAWTDTCPK